VEVLDQEDKCVRRRQRLDQLHPRVMQAIPCDDRMQIRCDVEAECESQDAAGAQKRFDPLGGVAVHDTELLVEDLRHRPICPRASV
jgi:hypothetical protein